MKKKTAATYVHDRDCAADRGCVEVCFVFILESVARSRSLLTLMAFCDEIIKFKLLR